MKAYAHSCLISSLTLFLSWLINILEFSGLLNSEWEAARNRKPLFQPDRVPTPLLLLAGYHGLPNTYMETWKAIITKPLRNPLIRSDSRQAALVGLCWVSPKSGRAPPGQLPTGKINAVPLNSFISQFCHLELRGQNLGNLCYKEQTNKVCCVKVFYQ